MIETNSVAIPTVKAIIDGKLVGAASGATFDVVSPINRQVIAELPALDVEDLDRAVAGGRKAFEERVWSGMPPRERKKILVRWAQLVEHEWDNLAQLQTLDMGAPLSFTKNLEVANSIDALRWFAEATDKLYEEMVNLEDTVTALIHRTPLGVVGCILPWNAPAMIGAWKMGPALAAGNSLILKPSEAASLVCLRMGELALEAGVPGGVLQVVTGSGRVIGQAMAEHADVNAITFTGSTAVGRRIMSAAADSNLKRVALELGGKSAAIVMQDVPDLEFAAEAQVQFMFGNQGQVCEAPTRLLVQRSIRDKFLDSVVKRTRALRVGNPFEQSSDLGPIVSDAQRDSVLEHMSQADRDGIEFALDGRTQAVPDEGSYLAPSIALVSDPHCALAQEEVFEPVLSVLEFDDIDQAIALANSTRYGLGANIWSDSLETVMYASKRLVAGNINVNGGTGPAVELPFGGFKESGFGRDRSIYAIDKYCDLKNVILRTTR